LKLDSLVARSDHGGVDRTVLILLGSRDIVLEASRYHRPRGMDNAERLIALREALDDDPEAVDVGELLESDRLALHLAPDRIGALAAALDGRGNAARGKLLRQL